jgi:mono/diheme cytochrome c family protein
MRTLVFLSLSTLFLTQSQFAQTAPGKPVTDAEKTGQKLFFQRCSVCHMGTATAYRLYGPPLYDDVVKASGDEAVRKKILDGSPAMPAWKYTFKPAEVDKIIAFMKTLTKDDVVRQGTTRRGEAEVDQ